MKYGDAQEHWIVLEAAQNTNTTHTDTATTKMSRATLPLIFIFHFLLSVMSDLRYKAVPESGT